MADSTRQFRVTRLRLGDFRSIASCDVPLGNLAVLVGPNGAGKSNFFDALQLVSDALNDSLADALRDRLGVSSVTRDDTRSFSIDIDFEFGERSGRYAFDLSATQDPEYDVEHESLVFADGGDSIETASGDNSFTPSQLTLRILASVGDYAKVVAGFTGFQVLNPVPNTFLRPQPRDPGDHLDNDAANLASVWENLTRRFPERAARVMDYLRVIVPGVENVMTIGMGERYVGLQFEVRDGAGTPVVRDAASMSYGTLRALAVLVGIFGPYGDLVPPIAIEEPESGLHPAAAAALLDALCDGAEHRQVLVSTHSPEILDNPALDPDALIVVRQVDGVTILGPMDDGARKVVREGTFTAGDLLRSDQTWPEGYLDDLRDRS